MLVKRALGAVKNQDSKSPQLENVISLQWRHNERDGVSNHRCPDCFLNRLLRRRSKLRVTGLCEGNPSTACSTVCSGADQRKHQSPASLAFTRGIHRWPMDSPHKGPVTRKCFHLMASWCKSKVLPYYFTPIIDNFNYIVKTDIVPSQPISM